MVSGDEFLEFIVSLDTQLWWFLSIGFLPGNVLGTLRDSSCTLLLADLITIIGQIIAKFHGHLLEVRFWINPLFHNGLDFDGRPGPCPVYASGPPPLHSSNKNQYKIGRTILCLGTVYLVRAVDLFGGTWSFLRTLRVRGTVPILFGAGVKSVKNAPKCTWA
jgi:hypothetical protein